MKQSDSTPSIRLCPACLRKIYWSEGFEDKLRSGEWIEQVKNKTLESKDTFVPFRDYTGKLIVETQEVTWKDAQTGDERARLHRYIASDGSVGACGHADPKRIRLPGGRKYNLTQKRDDGTFGPCDECNSTEHK